MENSGLLRFVPYGDHSAGIQVLNTSNFPTLSGPLRDLVP